MSIGHWCSVIRRFWDRTGKLNSDVPPFEVVRPPNYVVHPLFLLLLSLLVVVQVFQLSRLARIHWSLCTIALILMEQASPKTSFLVWCTLHRQSCFATGIVRRDQHDILVALFATTHAFLLKGCTNLFSHRNPYWTGTKSQTIFPKVNAAVKDWYLFTEKSCRLG